MSGMKERIHISDNAITERTPRQEGSQNILRQRRLESKRIAAMTQEQKRQEQAILDGSMKGNHQRELSMSMEELEEKSRQTIIKYQEIYDRTRELKLKGEELEQRKKKNQNEDLKRQKEDEEREKRFNSNTDSLHNLGIRISENNKRIQEKEKLILTYEGVNIFSKGETYHNKINDIKGELDELKINQSKMNIERGIIENDQLSIFDDQEDIKERDKDLTTNWASLQEEAKKYNKDIEQHSERIEKYREEVDQSMHTKILACSIVNDQIPQAKEEESEKLPQTPEERARETQKLVSQANEIGLCWIKLGYVGPKNQEDRKELQRQKLRTAAWEYGLKPQDSKQKRKLEDLIYHALHIDIEENEIRALVKCWRILGNYEVKDKEKSTNQPMKDTRYEQYKKELANKKLRELSLDFGKLKKEFEKKNIKPTELYETSDKLEYHMEAIKSHILSEIDRITGKSSIVNFEDLPIGKECIRAVPLPEDNKEDQNVTLKEKLQRRKSRNK
jgi:hypothetical protein